jgi:hypothetical protein
MKFPFLFSGEEEEERKKERKKEKKKLSKSTAARQMSKFKQLGTPML